MNIQELLINIQNGLNQNASAITAISTFIYVIFTWRIIKESEKSRKEQEKLRKNQEKPSINVFIEQDKISPYRLNLVVQNNGNSGAYDLNFNINENKTRVKEDKSNHFENFKKTGLFTNGISFLPPDGKFKSGLTYLVPDLYSTVIERNIVIDCSYKDQYDKRIDKSFTIDFGMFENLKSPPKKSIDKIEKHFKNINKELELIRKNINKELELIRKNIN